MRAEGIAWKVRGSARPHPEVYLSQIQAQSLGQILKEMSSNKLKGHLTLPPLVISSKPGEKPQMTHPSDWSSA